MGSLYDVNVEGIGKVGGGRYKDVNVEGITTILDSIDAENIAAEGTLKVNGNITCTNISCEGMAVFNGSIDAKEHIEFEGVIKVCGNVQGKSIDVEGVLNMDGLLSADSISFEVSRSCNISEIGGSNVKIENNSFHKIGLFKRKVKVNCKVIEGDNIYLENVECDVVRGKNITIGPGCIIDKIEYSMNIDIDKSSTVMNSIRL